MGDFFDNAYYSMIKKYLTCLGQYPYQEAQSQNINLFLFLFSIISLMVPQIYQLSHSIRDRDLDHIIMSIPPLLANGICLVKYFNLQLNKKEFRKIFDRIKEEWEMLTVESEIRIFEEFAAEGYKFGCMYRNYMFGVLCLFVLMPLVPTFLDIVIPLNESRQQILMYEVDYLVDNEEYFYPIYAHAAWSSLCSVTIIITVDTTYMLIIHHACGLFALCGSRLTNLAQNTHQHTGKSITENNRLLYCKLRECVITHKHAIEFADYMEKCSRMSYLLQAGLNMLMISITGVQTVIKLHQLEEATRFGVFTVAQNIHLFFNSLPGQKILDYSLNLSNILYNADWYQIPAKLQKLLIIMQIRCTKPSKLTAGGLYEMNIENFGKIVKTSMSYFTMFLSIRE